MDYKSIDLKDVEMEFLLQNKTKNPLLVAGDRHHPAANNQLKVLREQVNVNSLLIFKSNYLSCKKITFST